MNRPNHDGSPATGPWDRTLMHLGPPLFIGPRLMAATAVGDDGSTLHIEPLHRDHEDRVVWRYIIEDANRNELFADTDLRSGSGAEVDPHEAMTTLVTSLSVAADAHRWSLAGETTEHADLFPPDVMTWAGDHENDLEALACDLEEPEPEHLAPQPQSPYLRPVALSGPIPAGWATEPVGEWNGQATEVVFNPVRHVVMVVSSDSTEDREGELAAAGWQYDGIDGFNVMWVLDRAVAARAALEHLVLNPPPEIGELGL